MIIKKLANAVRSKKEEKIVEQKNNKTKLNSAYDGLFAGLNESYFEMVRDELSKSSSQKVKEEDEKFM